METAPPPLNPGENRRRDRLAAAGIAAFALALRLIPWSRYFADGQALFAQHDAYYHVRRELVFLRNFPRIPTLDRYMAYPFGGECPWPPLYDGVVALLAWIVGLGAPSPQTVAAVASLLPPVLGALAVAVVFLLARRLAGFSAAVVASIVLSVFPGFLNYSTVGSGDHHTAEVLLLSAFFLLGLRAVGDGNGAGSRKAAAASGAALGAAILVWQGSILFAAFFGGGVVLWRLTMPAGRGGREPDPVYRRLFLSLGTALALVAAARLAWPAATKETRFDFGYFSWFQPAFLAVGLLCAVLFREADRRISGGGSAALRRNAWAFALLASIPLAAALGIGEFRANFLAGIRFVGSRHPWLASIAEFQPMFGAGSFLKGDFLSRVSSGILLAAFLFPPVFASALLAARRKRGEDTLPVAVFAFWSAVVLALALSQKRWVNAYSVNVAVAAGWGASLLLRDGLGSARAVRAWAALALLSVPLLAGLRESVLEPPPPFYEPDIRESLSWMRENTPRTPGLYELSTDPGYSVLSTWSNGHYIQLLGERPTVANNFGYQLPGEGLEDTLRYRFAADEAAMAEVCARRRVRFVYATAIGDILTSNGGLARLVGIDFKERFMTRQALPGGGTAESLDFRAFMSLPSVRLFIHDGAESRGGPAFGRFRLAYESATEVPLFPLPPGIRSVKIFEFVPGAVVKGRSAPGREIVLSCRMQSSQGREFEYRSTVMADGEGRFSARFPYATTWPAWAVAPLGRASASSSAGSVSFDVRDADVLEGREIELRVP